MTITSHDRSTPHRSSDDRRNPRRRAWIAGGLVTALVAAGASLLSAPTAAASRIPVSASIRSQAVSASQPARSHRYRHRTKVIMPIRQAMGPTRPKRTDPIRFHGGAVMTGSVHVYLIWYGDWSKSPAVTLISDLVRGFPASAYAGTNATYTDSKGTPAATDIQLAGSLTDTYSQGPSLTDAEVRRVITKAITSGALPADDHGIYAVLSSADVKETSGFATRYCGWHFRMSLKLTPVRYLYAGDPGLQGTRTCIPPMTGSANGDPGADALASTVVHEIDETITDPDIDAWYDRYGYENADKCAWTYGPTWTNSHGGTANVTIGGHDFLIQQNWVARSPQTCALS